tara:strand:- start:478 stop:651 length:174 start_codon:yes stop_codon:yes gene_type:complete
MKKLLPFILFSSTTFFSAINSLPVTAMGCSLHNDKSEKVCKEGDKKCERKSIEDRKI